MAYSTNSSATTYRVVTLTASVPHNFVTGTTATSTSNALTAHKGVEVTFQNQSTSAINVYIVNSVSNVPAIGSTSTLGVGGIALSQNTAYTIGKRHAPSAIQMQDWYVVSTSSNGICVAQLVRAV